MRYRAATFAAILVWLPAAHAQAVSADPALAPAGAYAADTAHTRISWSLSHFGTSTYTGWFKDFDIALKFDPNAPEKSELSAKVATASVATLDPAFDAEIAGDQFLNAAQFPDLTFKSTAATRTGDTTGTLTGDLTLHGITKPATFTVTFHGGQQSPLKNAYVLGFNATTTIKRSDFGVTGYLEFGLGDEVTIAIEGEFVQQNP
jgi:polyisoprenoid-binding protein YceI